MAESQPDNISADKFEAAEDSQIICESCNCVDISNDENDVETKGENEIVVCCITTTEFKEVEISIDKDVDVVSNLDVAKVNYENDGIVKMQNVDEDDKFLKRKENKKVFVQEKSLKDTSMKIFKSCIECDDYAYSTKDVV